MKIIGHRGAAGLALENSLESIKAAIDAGVDGIEIDIRLTKDNVFLLNHDGSTRRTSKKNKEIKTSSYDELEHIRLQNGEPIPTLFDALQICKNTPLYIEAKGSGWAEELAKFLGTLRDNTRSYLNVLSFHHQELTRFHNLCPDIKTFALEHTNPFRVLDIAARHGLHGIDINFWVLNPLVYWMAGKRKLKIIVYTVNHAWIARFIKYLYPLVAVTTNVPQTMQLLRIKRSKKQ